MPRSGRPGCPRSRPAGRGRDCARCCHPPPRSPSCGLPCGAPRARTAHRGCAPPARLGVDDRFLPVLGHHVLQRHRFGGGIEVLVAVGVPVQQGQGTGRNTSLLHPTQQLGQAPPVVMGVGAAQLGPHPRVERTPIPSPACPSSGWARGSALTASRTHPHRQSPMERRQHVAPPGPRRADQANAGHSRIVAEAALSLRDRISASRRAGGRNRRTSERVITWSWTPRGSRRRGFQPASNCLAIASPNP